MEQGRYYTWLVVILVIALFAGFITFQTGTPAISLPGIATLGPYSFPVHQGLDLQGGRALLLEADVPVTQTVTASDMESVRGIIERRVNAFGLSESTVQIQGDRRLLVELPGASGSSTTTSAITRTAFLEWIDVGGSGPLLEGTVVRTDLSLGGGVVPVEATPVVTATTTATANPTAVVTATTTAATPGPTPAATQPVTDTGPVYHTVVSGKDLDPNGIRIGYNAARVPQVQFQLVSDASARFGEFTARNNETTLGYRYYMCIVLDKKVLSCPSIRSAIPDGQGVIELGQGATVQEAEALAINLRYGALRVPLKVVQDRVVGPTLGEDSLRKSIVAGVIGMLAVVTFMLLYYRLPGFLATLALLLYATVTIALYKLIPVTLTLPGIAGFVLSVGVAVDANVLIFERMKEELRGGRRLDLAVEAGFARAWPSIRDSNISTLITCAILWVFGNAYGASIVKGFAATLALGVMVSLFTAITVTRTFLHTVLDRMDFGTRHWWFGI